MSARGSWSWSLLLILTFPGCDDGEGQACVLDTDCTDFSQVCIESRCRQPGAMSEAGIPSDAGGTFDAGSPSDAAAPADAGEADDAGLADGAAMTDADPGSDAATCIDLTGTWDVAFVNAAGSCGGADVGRSSTITAAGECMYVATSDDSGLPAIDGTLLVQPDRMLDPTGTSIATGTNPAASCTGVVDAPGETITLSCDSCVMNLTRR